MSAYLGDFRTGKTIYSMWNSNAIAGESITRATNGTISVYKNSSNTQSTTGVTDTEDKDSLTGVHYVAIDTSADGTFYSAGSDFMVVLSAATIDGKTINAFLFQFSLENRSHLMPTTDGRKLDVSAGGEAGVDWANVGSPTTTVNLSGTTVKTATDVETDTADIQSRLPVALVSGRIDASVGAMAANVMTAAAAAADLGTEFGTAVWATAARTLTANTNLNDLNAAGIRAAIGMSSANLDTQLSGLATASALSTVAGYIDTEIGTILTNLATVDTVVDAIKAVTDLLPDGGALSSLATASALATVDTNVDTLLADIGTPIGTTIADQLSNAYTAIQQVANVTDMLVHTSGKLWVLDDNGNPLPTASDVAAIKAVTDKVDDTLEDDGGTYRFTTNALEQAPSGGGSAPTVEEIRIEMDANSTKLASIDAKTTNLPSDPADQSLIMAAIDDLPTNAELATALGTADDAVLTAVATVDTVVDGIALKVADLWALDGLDISNPMTVTPTSRTTGTIAQTISGDGTTTTTVTRTA